MNLLRKTILVGLTVAFISAMMSVDITTASQEEALVAYYPFNGNANDESGNSHHGTVNGAILVPDRLGNPDSAYSFDGIDDYIEILDHPDFDFGTGAFAVSVWIRTEATTVTQTFRDEILTKGNAWVSGFAISLENNKAAFFIGDSGFWFGSSVLNDGEWHQIVGTRDDLGNVSLYVDGIVECSGINNENVDTDTSLFIGKHGTSNESYFDGSIDDVRIFNREVPPQGVFLSPRLQSDFNLPGTTVNYTLHLANKTGSDDSFVLSVSGNNWPTVLSMDDTGIIPNGGSVSFTAEVEIPVSNTFGNNDKATITVTSASNPEMANTAKVTTWLISEGPLIAYYPFIGNADDESGNYHDGTVNGATLAPDRFGNPDSAYSFDGIDDYVEIPDHPDFDFGTGAFAVSVWIRTEAITTTQQGRDEILTKGNAWVSGFAISLRNNRAAFFVGYSGDFFGSSVINDGEWHQIVGTRDDLGNVLLYVDGIVECSGINLENIDTDTSLFIGKHGTWDEPYFDGFIDDVSIYNRGVPPQGVFLSPIEQEGLSFPGATVSYPLQVINRTGYDDSFILSVSSNSWPTVLSMDNTGIIPNGESVSFTVEVEIPASDTFGNNDTATITVTSVSSPEMTNTATVTTWLISEVPFVAYYPFNGNANDESGNYHHGTVNGATLVPDRFGNPNSAYSFDGIDDYIEIPDHIDFDFGIGAFTVSAWIKTEASNSEWHRAVILAKGHPNSYGFAISLEYNKAAFFVGGSGSFYGSSVLNDEEWHYIVGTRDNFGNISLYVDGKQEYSGINNESIDADSSLFIGKKEIYNYSYFDGFIDDVSIYNKEVPPIGVFLSPRSQEDLDFPGATVSYTLQVINRTGYDDSFVLSVSDNIWPTVLSMDDTGTIPNGGSVSFTVEVEIPLSATFGNKDSPTITVTSVSNLEMTNTATVNTLIISESPIAYYPFNGNADDESGNSHDGIVNGATLAPDRFGNPNSAYIFDGINDYIEIPHHPDFNFRTRAFTVSAWIRTEAITTPGWGRDDILAKGNPTGSGFAISLRNDNLAFFVGGSGSFYGSSVLNDGKWHHIVGTRDDLGNVALSVDGIVECLGTNHENIDTDTSLFIGKHGTMDESYFDGCIDDICIFNRYLPVYFSLTIATSKGGTTDPSPAVYIYELGTEVTVTAIPATGISFMNWSGDASGTSNPVTIIMDANKFIMANFSTVANGDISSVGGKGGPQRGFQCFIEKSSYGSPLNPYLEITRDFRDEYLLPSKLGREFVDLYYRYSPFGENMIARHKILKFAVRTHLIPLIAFSYSMVHFGPIITAVIIILVFATPFFFVVFNRRKLRQASNE